jgi:hypothetical protein
MAPSSCGAGCAKRKAKAKQKIGAGSNGGVLVTFNFFSFALNFFSLYDVAFTPHEVYVLNLTS